MRRILISGAAVLVLSLPVQADPAAVVATYADIAAAAYADSLALSEELSRAIDAMIDDPTPATLAKARAAWVAARVPYLQTEVYRFGNPLVDDWEGGVNAWPLDEGLIDYVDADYGGATDGNAADVLNVIATPTLMVSGRTIDATAITPTLLRGTLHEVGGSEANVATGYHAIEFLLWGQDLNGHGAGAGNRPATDFASGTACTNGNCDRRAAYLRAATDLLVADLRTMAASWAPGGAARAAATDSPQDGLAAMLKGMGSLSYGELAGERMRLGLMLNDPEEEQDCFSDNTHNSHYYNGLGIRNVYLGRYTRPDGTMVAGPSLADLVAARDPALDSHLRAQLDASVAALGAIRAAAEGGMAYDQMLDRGNPQGGALIMAAVAALIDQTQGIERVVQTLDLGPVAFEGSDSLDNPGVVFQ